MIHCIVICALQYRDGRVILFQPNYNKTETFQQQTEDNVWQSRFYQVFLLEIKDGSDLLVSEYEDCSDICTLSGNLLEPTHMKASQDILAQTSPLLQTEWYQNFSSWQRLWTYKTSECLYLFSREKRQSGRCKLVVHFSSLDWGSKITRKIMTHAKPVVMKKRFVEGNCNLRSVCALSMLHEGINVQLMPFETYNNGCR